MRHPRFELANAHTSFDWLVRIDGYKDDFGANSLWVRSEWVTSFKWIIESLASL